MIKNSCKVHTLCMHIKKNEIHKIWRGVGQQDMQIQLMYKTDVKQDVCGHTYIHVPCTSQFARKTGIYISTYSGTVVSDKNMNMYTACDCINNSSEYIYVVCMHGVHVYIWRSFTVFGGPYTL